MLCMFYLEMFLCNRKFLNSKLYFLSQEVLDEKHAMMSYFRLHYRSACLVNLRE